jgi:hypothetical protein
MNHNRKNLLSGRDYTASIVTQVLSICGKIDDEMLKRLNDVRKKRNDFVHNLSQINSNDAGEAVRLASDLISKISGARFTTQLGLHYWI